MFEHASGARRSQSRLTTPGQLRVPQITALFWFVKLLSTALGEASSDYLVHAMAPVLAVLLGFVAFLAAMAVQFRMKRYVPWSYWFAVAMVGVFGTMAADVLHVAFGVPYTASSIFYAVVLATIFITWRATEGTLSIHSIDTARREAFYWATVVATFAMGTALGDFSAYTLHLGYFPSALVFAAVILVPAAGFRWLRCNGVLCFWFAYIVTRPLGASIADGLGKPRSVSGLGYGNGTISVILAVLIIGFVAYLARSRADVQQGAEAIAVR